MLAGVQGVAAVEACIKGMPFEHGNGGDGIGFQGRLRIGKKRFLVRRGRNDITGMFNGEHPSFFTLTFVCIHLYHTRIPA